MKLLKLSVSTIRRPSEIRSEDLLKETAEGLALMKVASEALLVGGDVESDKVSALAAQYMDPEQNAVFQTFESLREFAFTGKHQTAMERPIFNAFPFIYAVTGMAECFGFSVPHTCSYVMQAAYAREKLYRDVEEIPDLIHDTDASVEYHDDFPTGKIGDYVSQGMMVLDLALLTGMDEQTVRNGLNSDPSVSKSLIPGSKMFEVPSSVAREWIKGRGDFVPSMPPRGKDQIKVPQAKDGTVFDASCKAPSGYRIGPKGDEEKFDNYDEALNALMGKSKHYWRRPNEHGRMGIVRSVDYVWRTREELGL